MTQPLVSIIIPAYNSEKHIAEAITSALDQTWTEKELKMKYQFQKLDFTPLIERIIELDQDDARYIDMLNQPWFLNNTPPKDASLKDHWIKIFSKQP